MSDNTLLKIIIEARNNAKTVLDSLDKTMQDVGKSASKANANIGKFRGGLNSIQDAVFKAKSSLFSLKGAVITAAAAFGAFKVYSYIKESTLLNARYKTLGVSLVHLGEQAGYSATQLKKQEEGLQDTGIAMVETRAILARMIQSQLDLTKATELARVAQNVAVIANLNSSETFERMIHSIQANSVEILRTIGMNVSFENSYKKLEKTIGRSLTESEKVQARFNAVLEAGASSAGAYEAAMTTAGKQMNSLKRYTDNLKVALGEAFEPTLAEIIKSYSKFIKEFTEEVKDPAFQNSMSSFARIIGDELKKGLEWLIDNKEAIFRLFTELAKIIAGGVQVMDLALGAFISSENKIRVALQHNYAKMGADLAKFISERDEILNRMAERDKKRAELSSEGATPLWKDPNKWAQEQKDTLGLVDFGKDKRKLEELNVLIEKYHGLMKEMSASLNISMKGDANKVEEVITNAFGRAAGAFKNIYSATNMAMPFTLTTSQIKRSIEDIKLALEELKSDYDNRIIDLKNYYDEKGKLDKKAFEQERKLLQAQANREIDLDKKQKILDAIYALEKQYQIKVIGLNDEKIKAEKDLAKVRFQIEEQLQQQKLELLTGSKSLSKSNKAEVDQLKLRQVGEIKALEEQGARRDQINEQRVIHNQQVLKLEEDQEKKLGEERLKIKRDFQSREMNLTAASDIQARFENERILLEQEQADRLKTLEDSKIEEKERLGAIEEHYRMSQLEAEKLSAEQRLELHRYYVEAASQILGSLNNIFGDLYAASGSKMKAFFRLQKAVSIAQTIMKTYEAAQEVYLKYASTSKVLASAMAGLAVLEGMARVAVIRSQNYAKGGLIEGYSPTNKSDNVKINATAGEYMQPVDTVKHYGVSAMEAIRRKAVPREVLSRWGFSAMPPKRDYSYATGGLVGSGAGASGMETSINVNVYGGGGGDPRQMGESLARVIKMEFNKNLVDQMRPGGLLNR